MDTIGLGRPCKICIDPGHGGRDSGCSHFGVNEKDPNLKIGLRLKDLLVAQGHTVFLTRTGDSYMELTDRGRYSVARGSDLFVSVHHDSADAARRGCSSFVRFVEYRNGFDLGTQITTALDEEFHHGFAYGTKCQKHWVNLGVLRGGNNDGLVTATVVECACLSSAKDFELIKQEGYPERTAFAILTGIHRHLGLIVPGEPEVDPPGLVHVLAPNGDEIECNAHLANGRTEVQIAPVFETLHIPYSWNAPNILRIGGSSCWTHSRS